MLYRDYVDKLKEIVLEHGFTFRRNACFRISGDGVLQVLRLYRDHATQEPALDLGLHSMYSTLRPEWFTATQCITKYPIVLYDNKRSIMESVKDSAGNQLVSYISIEKQLSVLGEIAIDRLNGILTQHQLLDEINRLECIYIGNIYWLEMEKYAIYLHIKEYDNAAKIIKSILKQHADAYSEKERSMAMDGLKFELKQYEIDEDIWLNKLLKMALDRDDTAISQFLRSNLEINTKNARIRKKK